MRFVQAPLSLLVVVATTLPAWLSADGVQLPEAIVPQSSDVRDRDLLAQGERVTLQQTASSQRGAQTQEVEISRTDRSGRSAELRVRQPQGDSGETSPAAQRVRPQVVISDQAGGAARITRQPARSSSPASMASALFPQQVSPNNPYGDINDTRGLRPYKPGVRYDRQMEDDRDSSVFGLLFGR